MIASYTLLSDARLRAGAWRRRSGRGARHILRSLLAGLLLAAAAAPAGGQDGGYVRVSPRDPRYLELSDGRPYVPIGLNLIAGGKADPEASLATLEGWMRKLAANRGNYFRLWLGHADWDVEPARAGVFDEARGARIVRILDAADSLGLRVKLTLEHFRHLTETPRWSGKPIYHVSRGGMAAGMQEFLTGEAGRAHFRRKLDWYAARVGERPTVFAWELWNEINAVEGGGVTPEQTREELEWTAVMLPELHRRFPRTLATQSLGSFDDARVREPYRAFMALGSNDLAQVHRYLDLGARLEVAHGPVDVLAADAVKELRAFRPGKPVLLAESGAVEPRHTGPFRLYPADTAGVILHDILFAPFFAGAAGPGQIWHWDSYVAANDLWRHFARFAAAIEGVDPPAERFEPSEPPHERLRVYALTGRKTILLWCRDRRSDWRSELERREPAPVVRGERLDLSSLAPLRGARVRVYDPWTDHWTRVRPRNGVVRLPDFRRSLVVRVELGG